VIVACKGGIVGQAAAVAGTSAAARHIVAVTVMDNPVGTGVVAVDNHGSAVVACCPLARRIASDAVAVAVVGSM